ncbi:MAG: hypothetical protein IAF94_21005 [Pirellulaceae bacterium]|nr:hypothetical protein [Pirellulaceae bacterium]
MATIEFVEFHETRFAVTGSGAPKELFERLRTSQGARVEFKRAGGDTASFTISFPHASQRAVERLVREYS